jgi:zinc protease
LGKLPPRATLTKVVQELFGAWKQKPVPAYSPAKPPDSKRGLVLVDRPGSVQADVQVAKIAATYGSPELFPLQVGNMVLGGGASSRLFNDIREKRGFAYDVHTEFERNKDMGLTDAVTQVRNDVVEPAVQALLDDMAEMGKSPVGAQELTDAKNFLAGIYLLQLEPQSGLADLLVRVKTMDLPNDYIETFTTHIRSVEPDQIEKVAKQYISPENSAIVVVGDASKIQKSLEKFGTVQVAKPN